MEDKPILVIFFYKDTPLRTCSSRQGNVYREKMVATAWSDRRLRNLLYDREHIWVSLDYRNQSSYLDG